MCVSYGDALWSGSEDCSVRIWDLTTCRPVTALTQHKGAVTCVANVPAPPLSPRSLCTSLIPGLGPGVVFLQGGHDYSHGSSLA